METTNNAHVALFNLVVDKYYENCQQRKIDPLAPATCWSCGYAVLLHFSKKILEEGFCGPSGCPKCGRTFCD